MDPNQIPQQGVPQGMPQVPLEAGMEGNQPITEEQKQELLSMISEIRSKLGSFNALRFASKNKTEQTRRNLLKQVFEKLQMAGVDLTDRESVANFIATLRQSNPELADMFESSMDVLLGGAEGGSFATPQDSSAILDLGLSPQNNMNNINQNNEGLQPNI
jgi:hypothetical protein